MQNFETIRDAWAQRHDVPGDMVLMASEAQRSLPVLDGNPIPVMHPLE